MVENASVQTPKIQKYILKLFPEIMVKGDSAKRQMVGQLYNNLIKILAFYSEDIQVKKFSDKIEVLTPIAHIKEVRQRLLDTSGIEQVLEVLAFDAMQTLDQMKVKVNEIMGEQIVGKTFVVRVKRSGKHPFTSNDIARTIGGYMLEYNDAKGVDLHHPEVTIRLELIHNQLNIITTRYEGLGGFPLGTQGEILSLMSGGFDSTVASYLTLKRGMKTSYIFFNLGGIAHEIGVKQVAYYLWSKFGASHRAKFISIPFDEVVSEIFNANHPTYMGIMLKRLMLQASERIADEMGIDALLTGESVAQVSSQTLRNLALIDQVTNRLILRPLATMDKPQIVKIATQIGTKEFAENMPEYCGVISKSPTTFGSYKRMEKESKAFDYRVLDKAIESAKTLYVDEIVEDITQSEPVEVIRELDDEKYVIIDIRSEDSCIEASCESIKIPFHRLKIEFKKLPKDKSYLLYCEKGVMSQLHAQYLNDIDLNNNVRVYRP